MKVEASTYTICEYSMGTNPKVVATNWWTAGIATKEEFLSWEPKFKVMWKDGKFLTASFSGTRDGYPENANDVTSEKAREILEDKLEIGNLDTVCPAKYDVEAVWIGYTDTGYSRGSYTYNKVGDTKTLDDSQISSLSCVYGGDRENGTDPPYLLRESMRKDNAERFPGEMQGSSYKFHEITLSFDKSNLLNITSNNFKSGEANSFLGISFDPTKKEVGRESVYHYEQLFNILKTKECPEWLFYHPDHGFYLGTGNEWQGKEDKVNFEGTSWWLSSGGDDDYAMYQVSYEQQCNEIMQKYNNALDIAEGIKTDSNIVGTKTLRNKVTAFINNKNMTKADFEQIKQEIQNLTTYVNSSIPLDEYNKYFNDNAKCKTADGNKIIERKNQIISELTGSSDSISMQMEEAILASTSLNDAEKEELIQNNSDLFDDITDQFDEFTLTISTKKLKCETLFGDFDDPSTFGGFLQVLFNYVKIIAPILVIIFGSLDFGKAVLSSDQDALKKAQKDFVKRLIAAAAIFFLPNIIMLVLQLVNDQFSNIDPACMLK